MLSFVDHLQLLDFQTCMKHYQREFTADERLNKRDRKYPVPFSVFSRVSPTTGNGKVVATFGGITVALKQGNLKIENYASLLTKYQWRIKVDLSNIWIPCETVREILRKDTKGTSY